jgi:hypothetical protein
MSKQQFQKDAMAVQQNVDQQVAAAWTDFQSRLTQIGQAGVGAVEASARSNGVSGRVGYSITLRGMDAQYVKPRVLITR